MVFVVGERYPLLRSSQGWPRVASLRFATYAIFALTVVCFAAFTVLEERAPRPSELLPSKSDIETQPGQLGGADPYSPRRFSPYVSLSAPELLDAQEKLHEKQLDFFLKSPNKFFEIFSTVFVIFHNLTICFVLKKNLSK